MRKPRVSKADAAHIVARVSGVKAGDSKEAAALKVIETMRLAGFPTRAAERMLAKAKREGRA